MFDDIGALELVALVIVAVIVFGPEKLPKLIQDASRFVRKIRDFSDSAKADIRSELGPDFKDFEFEDLNPKTFVRKQLMENEDLQELRSGFDFKKEMADVTDAVHGRDADVSSNGSAGSSEPSAKPSLRKSSGDAFSAPDLLRKRDQPSPGERAPFDSDAT